MRSRWGTLRSAVPEARRPHAYPFAAYGSGDLAGPDDSGRGRDGSGGVGEAGPCESGEVDADYEYLMNLAPDIQEAILHLPKVREGRDPVTERDLRAIVAVVD